MRIRQVSFIALFLCVLVSHIQGQIRIKRVKLLQSGLNTMSNGIPVCCDSDHNGFNEIIFRTGTILPSNPVRWEVWEHRPMNQYELVFADTGAYPSPPGITTGRFRPNDVGDIDSDSLTDLVGPNWDEPPNSDTFYYLASTQESPNYSYYPTRLSWWFRHSSNFSGGDGGAYFYFPPDLDNDGRKEILKPSSNPHFGLMIFENVSNNNNAVVFTDTVRDGYNFTFGDFDSDGHQEFATATLGTLGLIYIRENTGDNQYQVVWTDTVRLPNGSDVFSGNDVDSDGHPEFFVSFLVVPTSMSYLYMWEATGNNTYARTLIDQTGMNASAYHRSRCGDIDGDSIEEIIWAIGTYVFIYKATGNNQFQQVWWWYNDHSGACAIVNVYDMNNNGYKEIVVGGAGKTSLFEVEAVRLLRPNGGEVFQANSQELIRWQKFYPPRCDSLSLFYSIDNGRTYQSIVHGLQSTDTSYLWTVPNVNSDSCKIKIIAYGPGWQYDESDGNFSITSTGIEENLMFQVSSFTLQVSPNPAKSVVRVRYSLPVESKISLKLYNVSGILVKTLVDEHKKSGSYSITLNSKTLSASIYFLSLETKEKRIIERLVIIK